MRIAADGFIDTSDHSRVRFPGLHEERIEPMPLGEALGFLLSHAFPGHRRVIRAPTIRELSQLRHAVWADSVSERMDLLDRVWRAITTPVADPGSLDDPLAIQVVQFERRWAYPLYLDRSGTRVLPDGGVAPDDPECPGNVEVVSLISTSPVGVELRRLEPIGT